MGVDKRVKSDHQEEDVCRKGTINRYKKQKKSDEVTV